MKVKNMFIYDAAPEGGAGDTPPEGGTTHLPEGGKIPEATPAPGTEPTPPGTEPTPPGTEQADETGDEDDAPEQFWNSTAEELGIPADVVTTWLKDAEDPMSVQAVVAFTKGIAETVRQNVEEELKNEDPRAYAYRLHRQRGGTDEEFLQGASSQLPEREKLENSIDLQRKFFVKVMTGKGIEADEADVLLERAVKDGKLATKVLAFYDAARQDEETELATYEQALQQAQAAAVQQYQQTIGALNNTIKGETMPIHIPEADQAPFQKFVQDLVFQGDDKNFYVGIPATGDGSEKLLQALYLLYAKGDLNRLKPREVRKTLPRLGAPKIKQPIVPPAGTQTPGAPDKGTTLQDFFPQ